MTRHVQLFRWLGPAGLATGTVDGARVGTDGVVAARGAQPPGPDRTEPQVCWRSPTVPVGFPATDLVLSWDAHTPRRTWVELEVRVGDEVARWSPWLGLGRWCSHDDLARTTVPDQHAELVSVEVDRLAAIPGRHFSRFQVRVRLLRPRRSEPSPVLRGVSAMVSNWPSDEVGSTRPASRNGDGLDLPVPAYAQRVHAGHFPHWDGGGASWCSPASTSMVLGYWGRLPDPGAYSWVDAADPAPWVDYAAAATYDAAYHGTGNWSFNVAYASGLGLDAFVTRLRSVEEAEQFLRAGIPLVASLSFEADELTGAGYSTTGHLMVVRGLTPDGDVVVNDPAAHASADDEQVRTVYRRAEFARIWLDRCGGLVYVIRPHDVPLPPTHPFEPNW